MLTIEYISPQPAGFDLGATKGIDIAIATIGTSRPRLHLPNDPTTTSCRVSIFYRLTPGGTLMLTQSPVIFFPNAGVYQAPPFVPKHLRFKFTDFAPVVSSYVLHHVTTLSIEISNSEAADYGIQYIKAY